MSANSANPLLRFDGAAAWARLSPENQADIGALLMELVATDVALSSASRKQLLLTHVEKRALEASETVLEERVVSRIRGVLAAQFPPGAGRADFHGIPVSVGRICRGCGCTERDGCVDHGGIGCHWIESDLCSRCRPSARAA
ncbi:MAG: hypothetical protein AB7O45_13070 [Alphaproteobacteria bacterium]